MSTEKVRGSCPHDCPDRCSWVVTVEDGRAVSLVGDPHHPETRGTLCAKVDRFVERAYHPERLTHPLRRTGPKGSGSFERVTWDEALDDIAERVHAIVSESGGASVLPYSFSGTQGLLQANSMGERFFRRIGASALERTICGTAAGAGVSATLGTNAGLLPSDLAHSRLIVLWGTNTVVTNLHLWPTIRRAREQGARIVVVDPLETRTALAADWHIRPMPGTDGALALGMMHVIVAENLHDADYLARYTVGFEQLRARLEEYPPDRVAELTGLDADEIVSFARTYAATRPAAIRVLVGLEHHRDGEMMLRTISCLPALTGAWRDRGGGLVLHPLELFAKALNPLNPPDPTRPPPRAFNMVQLGRALTDESLDPPVRALFVYSSNPAVTTPQQELVLQGLGREDLFTVVHEQFLTDTARYADYVLPATSQLEHWDLMVSWGHTYLALNRPAIAPVGECVSHTELFRRLATRMGLDDPALQAQDEDLIRHALSSRHEYLDGISLERLMDQGWAALALPEPWMPLADGHFPTRSGRCELYSEPLAEWGIDPLPGYRPAEGLDEARAEFPLMLLTPKSALHFLNSSYANLERNRRAEKEPHLDLHPVDAESRGIRDGDTVEVTSPHGRLRLAARVSSRTRAGVVAVPSGWWASLSATGRSVNTLTGDTLTAWSGGAAFHDTVVEVRVADGAT